MSRAEKVVDLFEQYNCAQSVFAACCPPEKLGEQTCLAVAGAFGGGMGRMGEVCGAVTGALMVLGVRCSGQEMATNPTQARGALYARAGEFTDAFKEKNGSLLCRELTGCDLRTAAGQDQFKDRGLHGGLCRQLLIDAVELLGE